ncbi:MAG TPA: hypothetical protein VLF90_01745 [Patescibacteria group bacterium]|nr:hypothetical protein [Patescibacteria group bacterium]
MKQRILIIGFTFLLLVSIGMSIWRPNAVKADTIAYNYTNSQYKTITGPEGTFNEQSSGIYTANGSYVIRTSNNKDGGTSGTITNTTTNITRDISIGLPQPYSGVWLDHSTIKADNGKLTFVDGQIDKNLSFAITNGADTCQNKDSIDNFLHGVSASDNRNATATAQIHIFTTPGGGNNNCVGQTYDIKMSDPSKAFETYFVWQDAGTITTSDSRVIFTQSNGSGPFYGTSGPSGDSNCVSSITATAQATSGQLILRNGNLKEGWPTNISDATLTDDGKGCSASSAITEPIGHPENAKKPVGSSGLGSSGSNVAQPQLSCSTQITNPLTWFICPIIDLANGAISAFDNEINSQLNINTDKYLNENNHSSSAAGPQYYAVWSSMRYLALSLLVITGLVMVISQALSIGVFDAYTIRKVLPRMVLAVIFISLSWELLRLLVDVSNALGNGIRTLIYAPFVGGKTGIDSAIGVGAAATGVQGLVAIGGLGIGIAFGLVGMLTFALTGLIAVFTAIAVLVFRQILILLLIATAPLAIVCFILPNTQKVWKMWWENLIKALLMFVMIEALIAAGRVFAATAKTTGNSESLLTQLIVFVAYFGPYFLLPATFRLAGGIMSSVGSFATSSTSGLRKGLSSFRSNRAGDRVKKFRAGGVYNQTTKRGRFGNSLGGYLFNPDEKVPYKLGTKGGAVGRALFGGTATRLGSEIEEKKLEHSGKVFEMLNKSGMNDKGYRAISGAIDGLSEPVRKKFIENGLQNGLQTEADYHTAAEILQSSDVDTERKAASALERAAPIVMNKQRYGLGYGDARAAGLMGLSAHGFTTGQDLGRVGNLMAGYSYDEDNNLVKKGATHGSVAFSEAAIVQSELYGVKGSPDVKAGYGHVMKRDANGNFDGFVSGVSDEGGRGWDLLGSIGQGEWAGAKAGMFKADRLGGVIQDVIDVGGTDATKRDAVVQKWRTQGASQDTIDKRLNIAQTQRNVVLGELSQMAGSYSYGPADSRVAATEILKSNGLEHLANQLPTAEEAARQARLGGPGGGGGNQTPGTPQIPETGYRPPGPPTQGPPS